MASVTRFLLPLAINQGVQGRSYFRLREGSPLGVEPRDIEVPVKLALPARLVEEVLVRVGVVGSHLVPRGVFLAVV